MTNPSLPLVHELIRSACTAPSVHNTQPWAWRVLDASTIELYADRSRQLRAPTPGAATCGICPVAYEMSACLAIEDACGVAVPDEVRLLRRLLHRV